VVLEVFGTFLSRSKILGALAESWHLLPVRPSHLFYNNETNKQTTALPKGLDTVHGYNAMNEKALWVSEISVRYKLQ
jgi:hypothetical protein